MTHRTFNIIGLLFVAVACMATCMETRANTHETALAELCEFHGVAYCPAVRWTDVKPDKVKDGKIACGFTAKRERVCEITLWPGADTETVRHEFAHFLTWLRKSDGRNGEFKHEGAFKRARSAVGALPKFAQR